MSDPLSAARRQLAEWDDWLAGVGYDERTFDGRSMVAVPFAAAIKHLRATLAEVDRLTGERDAYKRAKAENDERFMLERDEARAERDALRDQLDEAEARCDAFSERLARTDQPWRVPGCTCEADAKSGDRCDARWARCNSRLAWLRELKAKSADAEVPRGR